MLLEIFSGVHVTRRILTILQAKTGRNFACFYQEIVRDFNSRPIYLKKYMVIELCS